MNKNRLFTFSLPSERRISYEDFELLICFLTKQGKIVSRNISGLSIRQ